MSINTRNMINGTLNYGVDAQADDDYEVAIPNITALVPALTITFLANTANTDGATLEITSVGDVDAILKNHDVALATGDIEAGQIVTVVWDGTNRQMTSQLAIVGALLNVQTGTSYTLVLTDAGKSITMDNGSGSANVYDHASGNPGVTGYGNAGSSRGDDFKASNI